MKAKVIHIAGSKGKGTTAWLIAKGLLESGKRVGLFTSPFLLDESEMIRVDGQAISKNDLSRLLDEVNDSGEFSEFEALTEVAFRYFEEKDCEYAVLECGWGGKRDATNKAENKVLTLLAHVELEHTQVLGKSLKEITQEKLGIVRPGVPLLVCVNQEAEVMDTIEEKRDELGFSEELAPIEELGHHHPESAGLALYALEKLGITLTKEMRETLENLVIPGVFEIVKFRNHTLILDGAHTYDSIHSLQERVLKYATDNGLDEPVWAIHTLNDKPSDLWTSFPRNRTLWVHLEHERASPAPEELPVSTVDKIFRELALEQEPRLLVFSGTFRLVAEIKKVL